MLINSKKKNCVEIKKIKGNISKSTDGALSSVRKKGRITLFSISLKKEISSKILKMITSDKNINEKVLPGYIEGTGYEIDNEISNDILCWNCCNNFNISEFHNKILESGCIPLALLENKINNWINSKLN